MRHSLLTRGSRPTKVKGGIEPDCFVGQPTSAANSQFGTSRKVCWMVTQSQHAFRQTDSSAVPGSGGREWGGSGAADPGSMRSLVFCGKSGPGCSTFASVPVAGYVLGGLGAGLAVGGPRFVEAVARTGPASGSSRQASFVGHVAGRLERWGFVAGGDVADLAVKQVRSRHSAGPRKSGRPNRTMHQKR